MLSKNVTTGSNPLIDIFGNTLVIAILKLVSILAIESISYKSVLQSFNSIVAPRAAHALAKIKWQVGDMSIAGAGDSQLLIKFLHTKGSNAHSSSLLTTLVAVATALLFEVFTVLLAPMIATTVFDEVGAHDSFDFSLNVLVLMQSCLRYYLSFDDNLFQIMKVTCLPNIIWKRLSSNDMPA